jgi:hypothetical protein
MSTDPTFSFQFHEAAEGKASQADEGGCWEGSSLETKTGAWSPETETKWKKAAIPGNLT